MPHGIAPVAVGIDPQPDRTDLHRRRIGPAGLEIGPSAPAVDPQGRGTNPIIGRRDAILETRRPIGRPPCLHSPCPMPYSGNMMPDTCDTMPYQAAEAAARSLLKRLDRNAHFRPFFDLSVKDGVMTANHASWDCVDMTSRFTDAWILARQMFDWPETEEEDAVRQYLLATQSPEDGLFYDFALPEPPLAPPCQGGEHQHQRGEHQHQRGEHQRQRGEHPRLPPLDKGGPGGVLWGQSDSAMGQPETADMFCQSRALMALTSMYLESGNTLIEGRIERLIQGLWNVAAHQDDFCYYPGHRYSPKGWTGVSAYDAKDLGPGALPAYGVLQILPLMRYWESTESSAAIRLIRGLINFFVHESGIVAEDGSFRGHLHSWGILPSTVGTLRYAMAAADDELMAWCSRVGNFIVANSSSFGWVPDGIDYDDGIITGETCCCTDLTHLAVKLAEAGADQCLDYVELMLRNQLLENQIRDTSGFRFASPEVEAMTLGSYDSWVMPNGLTGCSELGLEGCCTASAVRAFYLAWSHAIEASGDDVTINVMMSRRSEWIDTMSYQPWDGRFSVVAHKWCNVLIRMPGWMEGADLGISVNGEAAEPRPDGAYLRIDAVTEGTRIDITFPLHERRNSERIRGVEYQLTWRGPTLMQIDPPGTIYPIFRRTLDGMREQSTFDLARTKTAPSVVW